MVHYDCHSYGQTTCLWSQLSDGSNHMPTQITFCSANNMDKCQDQHNDVHLTLCQWDKVLKDQNKNQQYHFIQ
jgi:hypothetical protein